MDKALKALTEYDGGKALTPCKKRTGKAQRRKLELGEL